MTVSYNSVIVSMTAGRVAASGTHSRGGTADRSGSRGVTCKIRPIRGSDVAVQPGFYQPSGTDAVVMRLSVPEPASPAREELVTDQAPGVTETAGSLSVQRREDG